MKIKSEEKQSSKNEKTYLLECSEEELSWIHCLTGSVLGSGDIAKLNMKIYTAIQAKHIRYYDFSKILSDYPRIHDDANLTLLLNGTHY